MIIRIEKQVEELFKDQLCLNEVDPTASLQELGADSLDAVELVMAIEDIFHIEVTDEEAQSITSMQDAIDLVKSKKQ